jgi:hypothetical protein
MVNPALDLQFGQQAARCFSSAQMPIWYTVRPITSSAR